MGDGKNFLCSLASYHGWPLAGQAFDTEVVAVRGGGVGAQRAITKWG